MSDLPPFLYRTYRQNLHRTTTKTRKDRELHKLERAFFALPAKAYVRWQHVRHKLKPKPTQPPTGGFLMPENNQEG